MSEIKTYSTHEIYLRELEVAKHFKITCQFTKYNTKKVSESFRCTIFLEGQPFMEYDRDNQGTSINDSLSPFTRRDIIILENKLRDFETYNWYVNPGRILKNFHHSILDLITAFVQEHQLKLDSEIGIVFYDKELESYQLSKFEWPLENMIQRYSEKGSKAIQYQCFYLQQLNHKIYNIDYIRGLGVKI